MLNFIKGLFSRRKENQRTFCYCPECGNELISSNSLVPYLEEDTLVKFKCTRCRTVTDWLFETPAPLLIYVDGERYDHNEEDK